MGNTTSGNNTPAAAGQDAASKEVHIRTDKADGFYFTGEYLTGTVEIPLAFLNQYSNNKSPRKTSEVLRRRSLGNTVVIELVGDATYSAEVDAAADSDGHATHQVNVCRQRCFVTINAEQERLLNPNQLETSFDQTNHLTSENATILSTAPTSLNGTFELQIPDGLPPSLMNNRPPSVAYTLELNLSSSRYRYQIPILLSSKGCIPQPVSEIDLTSTAVNQHELYLQANLFRRFFRPGEQIPVRVSYSNPHQRAIRSITVTLHQFYRIHNDQYRCQLDGKEWTLDSPNVTSQRDWIGETLLQLPSQPLPASFTNYSVGTTQTIECELDYRIFVELNEKKGDDVQLTLPPVHVTYQAWLCRGRERHRSFSGWTAKNDSFIFASSSSFDSLSLSICRRKQNTIGFVFLLSANKFYSCNNTQT